MLNGKYTKEERKILNQIHNLTCIQRYHRRKWLEADLKISTLYEKVQHKYNPYSKEHPYKKGAKQKTK
jgi:hypothetical protein